MMAMAARSRSPLQIRDLIIPPAVFLWYLDLPRRLDKIEQQTHLLSLYDRRDAYLTAESRSLDEHGRILGNDLLDDEPVEQAAQCRQLQFDGGRGQRLGFDISRCV
jgi:hypothetical protein